MVVTKFKRESGYRALRARGQRKINITRNIFKLFLPLFVTEPEMLSFLRKSLAINEDVG